MTKLYEIIIYAAVIGILGIIYLACFSPAQQGYGYPGYRGYHHHHSYWYFRSYDESYNPSVRESSLGGHNASGKGIHGGK